MIGKYRRLYRASSTIFTFLFLVGWLLLTLSQEANAQNTCFKCTVEWQGNNQNGNGFNPEEVTLRVLVYDEQWVVLTWFVMAPTGAGNNGDYIYERIEPLVPSEAVYWGVEVVDPGDYIINPVIINDGEPILFNDVNTLDQPFGAE